MIMASNEQLKQANQDTWRQTVKAAEQVFNEKGISETMDLMPSMQGVAQLKTTINTLANDYKDDPVSGSAGTGADAQPKPQVNSLS